jgi:hypothetical protein
VRASSGRAVFFFSALREKQGRTENGRGRKIIHGKLKGIGKRLSRTFEEKLFAKYNKKIAILKNKTS